MTSGKACATAKQFREETNSEYEEAGHFGTYTIPIERTNRGGTGGGARRGGEALTLNRVVTSATRRDADVQDVAIAVTALSADDIVRQNVVNTTDLQRVAPSLLFSTSNSETGGSTIRIRGIGTTGNNSGLEGAVGVFIDGVYRSRAGLALSNLYDVNRVEVLRGPQGTLFGKNTSAGALVVGVAEPDASGNSGFIDLTYGNFDNTRVTGAGNLAISDVSAVRLSMDYQKRDGFIEDPVNDTAYNDRDRVQARLQFATEFGDHARWRLVYDYAEKDETCCASPYRKLGPTAAAVQGISGVTIPTDPFDRENTLNRPPLETTDDWGLASHFDYDFGDISLKTVLATREFNATNNQDVDFGPANILNQVVDSTFEITSMEATLQGSMGRLDWLVGGFYAEESIRNINQTVMGTQTAAFVTAITAGLIPIGTSNVLYAPGNGNVSNEFYQDSTTYSFFTHNVLGLTDTLDLTGGLRFNSEEKTGGGRDFVTVSPSCSAPGLPAGLRLLCPRPDYESVVEEEEVTGTLSLAYKPSTDLMFYASYSHGYKAGGINLDRDATIGPVLPNGTVVGTQAQINAVAVFDPEFSDSYEIGVKSELFDNRLQVNATLFQAEFKDFQLNTFNGLGFTVSNPGDVTSEGVELESRWNASERIFLTFATTYADTKYGSDAALGALAGRQLTNAPLWTVNGSFNIEQPITPTVTGFFNTNASHRTKYSTGSDLDPFKNQDAFTYLNGRIGAYSDDSGWEIYAWADNLLDADVHNLSFNSVFQTGSISTNVGNPRTYGITLKKNF